jgi:hypothetical protein
MGIPIFSTILGYTLHSVAADVGESPNPSEVFLEIFNLLLSGLL